MARVDRAPTVPTAPPSQSEPAAHGATHQRPPAAESGGHKPVAASAVAIGALCAAESTLSITTFPQLILAGALYTGLFLALALSYAFAGDPHLDTAPVMRRISMLSKRSR